MHTPSDYTVAAAPPGAAMRSWDCAFCDAQDLRRPVFLASPFGVLAAGSRCAAGALYGKVDPSARDMLALQREVSHAEHVAREAEEVRLGRLNLYTRAVREFAVEQDAHRRGDQVWQGDHLAVARQTYHHLGGTPALGVAFPTFLIAVALTGLLPEVTE